MKKKIIYSLIFSAALIFTSGGFVSAATTDSLNLSTDFNLQSNTGASNNSPGSSFNTNLNLTNFGQQNNGLDLGSTDLSGAAPTTYTDEATSQQNVQNDVAAAEAASDFGCSAKPSTWFSNCMAALLYWAVLTPISFLLTVAAFALEISIKYSVYEIANFAGSQGIINEVWTTIRDIANLLFIAALVYESIKTILGKGDAKKVIANVVIAALLINFSLFFTKVIVDFSNIVTLQFYSAIETSGGGSISQAIMQPLKLTTIYSTINAKNSQIASDEGGLKWSNALKYVIPVYGGYKLAMDAKNSIFGSGSDVGAAALITPIIMGSLFIIILAFVFLTIAILFITRFIILIILMILSPLAFVGWVFPQLEGKVSGKWWSALIDQATWPPVFMLMMWVVVRIINSDQFIGLVGAGNTSSIVGKDPGAFVLIINFAVIIGLTISTIIISKQMGAKGAGFAQMIAGGAVFGTLAFGANKIFGAGKYVGSTASLGFKGGAEKIARDWANRPSLGATLKNIGNAATKPLAKSFKENGFDLRNYAGTQKLGAVLGDGGFGKGTTASERAKAAEEAMKERNKEELAASAGKRASELEAAQRELEAARKPGAAAGAEKAAQDKMQGILYQMSSKEITALDKQITTNEDIIKLLRSDQVDALTDDKNEKLSFDTKNKIRDSRNSPFKNIDTLEDSRNIVANPAGHTPEQIKAAQIHVTKFDDAMKTMGNKELANLDVATLQSLAKGGHLKTKVREEIGKRDDLAPTQRDSILKGATYESLHEALGGTAKPKNADKIKKLIGSMSGQDLASFIQDPAYKVNGWQNDKDFVEKLSMSKLNDMKDMLDDTTRRQIGMAILNNPNAVARRQIQNDPSGAWK